MTSREHWETVYRRKSPSDVSWYRPHLDRSLDFLRGTGLSKDAPIIDIGGGASTLVDDLVASWYTDVTLLDLSETAIAAAKARLGAAASRVHWIAGDVTEIELPPRRYDFWHDRAVFHFLVDEDARRRYVACARRSLRPGGHIVVATFGLAGPERCSGLDVARYSADSLHAEFGPAFQKIASAEETHVTPWGSEQEFIYCYCRLP